MDLGKGVSRLETKFRFSPAFSGRGPYNLGPETLLSLNELKCHQCI